MYYYHVFEMQPLLGVGPMIVSDTTSQIYVLASEPVLSALQGQYLIWTSRVYTNWILPLKSLHYVVSFLKSFKLTAPSFVPWSTPYCSFLLSWQSLMSLWLLQSL